MLKAVSTITLLLYLAFLYVQQLVYTSCNLETTIPWGSLDHSRGVLRVLWKILIVFSFMLDKQAQYKIETDLACFALGAVISHRCIFRASFFSKNIYFASAACDFLVTFLFLNTAIHRLFSQSLTVFNIVIVIAAAIIICATILTLKLKTDKDEILEGSSI